MAVFRDIMAWKLGDRDVRMAISKQIRCIIKEKESCGFMSIGNKSIVESVNNSLCLIGSSKQQ
jgi:hypothetical protein